MSFAPDRYTTFLIDLDNTLYPPHTGVFEQIGVRMTAFIAETLGVDTIEAKRIQDEYYIKEGATLTGLIRRHEIDADRFLDYVHDIDLRPLQPDPELRRLLALLPGQRIIFTNGSVRHADRVLKALDVADLFDAVFDIVAADFCPKPQRRAYERLIARFALDPTEAVFFEDSPRNLETAKAFGMGTVLIRPDRDWAHVPRHAPPAAPPPKPAYIDHVGESLKAFLAEALEPSAAAL